MMASESYDNLGIVQYLVEKGADVNTKNKEDKTALDIARDRKKTEIVEYLKNHGSTE